jgi:hypothetical protein
MVTISDISSDISVDLVPSKGDMSIDYEHLYTVGSSVIKNLFSRTVIDIESVVREGEMGNLLSLLSKDRCEVHSWESDGLCGISVDGCRIDHITMKHLSKGPMIINMRLLGNEPHPSYSHLLQMISTPPSLPNISVDMVSNDGHKAHKNFPFFDISLDIENYVSCNFLKMDISTMVFLDDLTGEVGVTVLRNLPKFIGRPLGLDRQPDGPSPTTISMG